MLNPLQKEHFGIFVIFGVNLRHFHLEKRNKLFGNAYWTTNWCHVEHSQHSNQRILSKT